MSRGPVHLFVVPWRPTEDGGVNQVVVNLYRHFEETASTRREYSSCRGITVFP